MRCPHCYEYVPEGTQTCTECGKLLTDEAPHSPEGSHDPGMVVGKSCPHCGADVAGSAKYCTACGKPVGEDAAPASVPAKRRRFLPASGDERPIGVVVTTWIYPIGGELTLLLILLPLLFRGEYLKPSAGVWSWAILLIGTLLQFVISWGLYSLHRWARIAAILFALPGVFLPYFLVMAAWVGSIPMAAIILTWLTIDALILYFLLLNRETVSAFQSFAGTMQPSARGANGSPAPPPDKPMDLCPNCGEYVPEGAVHCAACGKPLVEPAPSPSASPASPEAVPSCRKARTPEAVQTLENSPRALTLLVTFFYIAGGWGLLAAFWPDLLSGLRLRTIREILFLALAGVACLLVAAGLSRRTRWARAAATVIAGLSLSLGVRLLILSIAYSKTLNRPSDWFLTVILTFVFFGFGVVVLYQFYRGLLILSTRKAAAGVRRLARPIGLIVVTALYCILCVWVLYCAASFSAGPIGLFVLCFLQVVVAWGLYSVHRWARWIAILLSWLGVLAVPPFLLLLFLGAYMAAGYALTTGPIPNDAKTQFALLVTGCLVSLPMNAVVIYFLLFDKETVNAFK